MRDIPQDKTELVERFLNTQDKEFEVRAKELELAAKELEYTAELSRMSLEAGGVDREHQRGYSLKIWNKGFWVLLAAIAALLVFGIVALKVGEADLLESLGVSILISGTSFGAGYGFRRYKETLDDEDE